MLPKIAQISSPSDSAERRGAERRVISFGFNAYDSQSNARIVSLNLSRTGMLLQTVAQLEVGEKVQIDSPEAGLVEAKIMRRNGDQFGAMFDSPITQAALSAVLLASPATPPSLDEEEIKTVRRSYPGYDPVPEWLMWSVLTVTTLVTMLFLYALAFLPIIG